MTKSPLGKGWIVDSYGTKLKNGGNGTLVFSAKRVKETVEYLKNKIGELTPMQFVTLFPDIIDNAFEEALKPRRTNNPL